MKTETEIIVKLGQIKKTFRQAERNFAKYDNHEDMHAMEIMRAQVEILNWVLDKG